MTAEIKALPRPVSILERYTDDDIRKAAYAMINRGGHFASRIADAYFYADRTNRTILLNAFGHIFERHIDDD